MYFFDLSVRGFLSWLFQPLKSYYIKLKTIENINNSIIMSYNIIGGRDTILADEFQDLNYFDNFESKWILLEDNFNSEIEMNSPEQSGSNPGSQIDNTSPGHSVNVKKVAPKKNKPHSKTPVSSMNTVRARHLSAKTADLIEQTSIFQARYGKDYVMKPGSPKEAWELHQAIFDHQVAIANLLDIDALENPRGRLPAWWKWQETIDTGMVSQLAQEVMHLIACCAAYEGSGYTDVSPIIINSQRVIAGILHPSALLIASGEAFDKNAGSMAG